MNPLFAPPLRAASRSILRDSSSQSAWICQSCSLRTPTAAFEQQQGTRRRARVFRLPTTTNATSSPSLSSSPLPKPPSRQIPNEPNKHHSTHLSPSSHTATPAPVQQLQDPYGIIPALRTDDFYQISSVLASTSKIDPEYLSKIPKTTWTEIFRALDPRSLIRLRAIRQSSKYEKTENLAKYRRSSSLWFQTVSELFAFRQAHNITLDIVDYRLVLEQASAIGSRRAAHAFWTDMKRYNVEPDRLCYNAYLNAHMHNEGLRRKQLVTARLPRSSKTRGLLNAGRYDLETTRRIRQIVSEMGAANMSGDTSTYCIYIRTLANEGDMAACLLTLRDLWGVDIAALMQGEPGLDGSKRIPPLGSSTYPTQQLLRTIADVFGMNNRADVALHLFKFFASVYDLEPSRQTWYQFSLNMWMQTRAKLGVPRTANHATPTLAYLQHFGDRVRTAFNDNMTMQQFEVLFRSAVTTEQVDGGELQTNLARRLRLLQAGREKYGQHLHEYALAARELQPESSASATPVESDRALRRRQQHARLNTETSKRRLKRWCKYLISCRNIFALRSNPHDAEARSWRLRGMPHFLTHYRDFIPRTIKYRIENGVVELKLRHIKRRWRTD